MRSSRTLLSLLLLVAAAVVGPGALAADGTPTSSAGLDEAQVEALLVAARGLAADLAELRSLPRDEEHADRVLEARDRAARSLDSLLAATGLTREELVRLVDAGSLQRSTDENGEPVLRPLGEPGR